MHTKRLCLEQDRGMLEDGCQHAAGDNHYHLDELDHIAPFAEEGNSC